MITLRITVRNGLQANIIRYKKKKTNKVLASYSGVLRLVARS